MHSETQKILVELPYQILNATLRLARWFQLLVTRCQLQSNKPPGSSIWEIIAIQRTSQITIWRGFPIFWFSVFSINPGWHLGLDPSQRCPWWFCWILEVCFHWTWTWKRPLKTQVPPPLCHRKRVGCEDLDGWNAMEFVGWIHPKVPAILMWTLTDSQVYPGVTGAALEIWHC